MKISLPTDVIPAELRELKRWCCWRSIPSTDGTKAKKKPINPRTRQGASSIDPSTWVTFQEALRALERQGYDGLMFALHPDDGYVFIDLDDCRGSNKTIAAWAEKIVRPFNSYSEVSPSGTGVHILIRAKKPGDLCRKGRVECYAEKRFVAMTGRRLGKYSGKIETRQKELDTFYREHLEAISQSGGERAVSAVPVPEEKLVELLKHPKAASIYRGEHNGLYPSQSEADLALTDIAVKQGWSEAEVRTLIETARENAGADRKHDGYYALTFRRARGDLVPVDLDTARGVFKKWLFLPDTMILDVVLAVVASSHLPGDPCWVHIVGPPSSGKTENIVAVERWPGVYALTELTPAGLVSGRDSEDGQDHSLLPKLHCKTLAIKDFTPTIDAPKEQRQKLFSRLRDAFDGSQSIHTAMVGTRSHRGTFNCITGVTNAIEKLWRNTSLGERYLLYRHPAADPLKSAERALEGVPAKKQMREELSRAACGVLAGVDQDCVPVCTDAIRKRIVKMAALLATSRTYVERTRDHRIETMPEPEGPARIAQQLFKIGLGLALINRRTEIIYCDLRILARVTLDSMPLVRRKFLEVLAKCPAGKRLLTSAFITALGVSQPVVHEKLEELCLLKICNRQQEPANRVSYWLTKDFRELVEAVDLGTVGTPGTR